MKNLQRHRPPIIPQLKKRRPLNPANHNSMRHPLRRDSLQHQKFPRRACANDPTQEHPSGNHFPCQQAALFSRNAEIPSCASSASAFCDITSFAYAYAPA
jgi:hypothetical protein